MKAIIKIDVPDFQIGQEVNIHFKDSMVAKGVVALSQEPCEDAISRQDVLDLCDSKDSEYKVRHFKEDVECLPPVIQQQKIGRCKDCQYFRYDDVAMVDGIPLIVAHEICTTWGNGCKTRENGYCFMYTPKMQEVEE